MLSNNDGCVIARSNEAKVLGIGMSAPWHLYNGRFAQQDAIVRSSNYTLCDGVGVRTMRILADFAPDLETYSIGEAFPDLGGFDDGQGRLAEYTGRLRATVLQWTGLPVSVVVAPTKVLAKVAKRLAKGIPPRAEFAPWSMRSARSRPCAVSSSRPLRESPDAWRPGWSTTGSARRRPARPAPALRRRGRAPRPRAHRNALPRA